MAADRRPKEATLDLRRRLLRYRVRAWKARQPQVLDFPASLSLGFLEAAWATPRLRDVPCPEERALPPAAACKKRRAWPGVGSRVTDRVRRSLLLACEGDPWFHVERRRWRGPATPTRGSRAPEMARNVEELRSNS